MSTGFEAREATIPRPPVLVTGATGYIGGRLVPRLLSRGERVRVLVREPTRLLGRAWANEVEVRQGDVLQPSSLDHALEGVGAAYYLIHSMHSGPSFHRRDLQAARHFRQAAERAGIDRILYLGGLGDPNEDLSKHLRSRQETGRELARGPIPTLEFRAGVVVGSGSVSFEMVRYLAERLPIMIAPRWSATRIQPIAIEDLLQYLTAALDLDLSEDELVEIGGADILTYADMLLQYARIRGLRRLLFTVPVLTPRLSSYWVHWVTPIPASIARPLIDGLRNEVIVKNDRAAHLFPSIHPGSYEQAVKSALSRLTARNVETNWSDAVASSAGVRKQVRLTNKEGMIIERRQRLVRATAEAVYNQFSSLGGSRGWLYANWAWQLRGVLDRLMGGVGLRRGRRHPHRIYPGDAIDFWRVESVDPKRSIRLRAEMKLPGDAWLEFRAIPVADDQTELRQIAYFAPRGLIGWLYWLALYPIHTLIFSGLSRVIQAQAEATADDN